MVLMGITGANAQFTPGRLVVNRVGTGAASLGGTGTPIFLDEYQFNGTAGTTLALPTATTGTVNQLTQSGSATSDGNISLSQDGRFVTVPGYDGTTGTSGIASADLNRVVASVDASANVQTIVIFGTVASGANSSYKANNMRSAATKDGSGYFMAGANASGNTDAGIRYISTNATPTTASTATAVSITQQNTRAVKVFNNTLYMVSGSGSNVGVNTVGTAGTIPTNSGNAAVLSASNANMGSPYSFIILDKSNAFAGPDVMYVVDDNASNGGVYKFKYAGSSWTFVSRTLSALGLRGITGYIDASGNAQLFMSARTGIYTLTDAAAYDASQSGTISASAIALPGTNKAYNGLSFSPGTGVFTAISSIGSSSFSNIAGQASTASTFNFSGTGQVGPAAVYSSSAAFEVSSDGITYAQSISVSPSSGSFASQTIYVRQAASAAAGSNSGTISVYSANGTSPANSISVTGTVTQPLITLTPSSLTGLNTDQGIASASQSFTFSGSNLIADVTISAAAFPAFEVSLDNTTFSSAVTVTPASGSISNETVYVRMSAAAGSGTNSGTVSLTSSSATTKTVSVSGTVTGPTLSVSPVSVTGLNAGLGRNSAAQSFNVGGTNLTNNITVQSTGANAAYFELSTDNATFSSTLTLTPTGGTVASAPVYVRQTSAAPAGTNSGIVTVSTSPATPVSVAVSGTITAPAITVSPASLTAFSADYGSVTAAQQVTLSAVALNADLNAAFTGSPANAFEFSENGATYSLTLTVSPDGSGNVSSRTVYIRGSLNAPIGTTSGNIAFTSGAVSKTLSASVTILGPTFTYSPSALNTFKSVSGVLTASQSLTISGVRLQGDVTLHVPAGYEVSLDNTTFRSSDFTFTVAGSTLSQTVYVRMKAGNAKGYFNRNITLSTTNGSGTYGLFGQVTKPISSNSLVVMRVGDGVTALANTGNPIFLDEYSITGSLVQTIALPTSVYGKNHRIVVSGNASSEGLMTRSGDGKYIAIVGYDTSLTNTAPLAASASVAINRSVAIIDYDGFVDVTTYLKDYATGNNPRSAFTTNGTDIWLCGASGGVAYTTKGSTAVNTIVSTTFTNLRSLGYAELGTRGQLVVSSGSSSLRLGTVGTGTPTTTGNTITNLPGLPTSGSDAPYQFFFVDLNSSIVGMDVAYVAFDKGGIKKYSLVGSTWTANGSYDITNAYRGVSGFVKNAAGNVQLIASKDDGLGLTTIVVFTDVSGYNQTITANPTVTTIVQANTATTKNKFTSVVYAPVNENCGTASVWKGQTGASWDYAPNWCGGVPTATDSVVIPAFTVFTPTLAAGTSATVRALTVQGSFSIADNATLNISGNVLNNGTITGSTGSTVNFSGTAAQKIEGTGTLKAYNLTVSNTSSGRVTNSGSKVQVQNTFSLPSGGKYTNSGSTVLLSNATGTARLGVRSSATDYAGSLTIQRYLPNTLIGSTQIGANVMVGTPFTNNVLADFQTANSTMFGFPGVPDEYNGRPSVYFFNNDSADAPYQGWVKPTSVNQAMSPGTGARIFFSGRFFQTESKYTLTGTLPASLSYNLPLKRCDACTNQSGWNIVSNPVPSEISWRSTGWTKTDLSPAIYIWQQANKRYSVYTYSTPGTQDSLNGGTGIIPSGQGFFVNALTSSASLVATESVKSIHTTPWTGIQRTGASYRLHITGSTPAGYSNEASVGFRSDATNGYDANLDARLLAGSVVNIATIPNGTDKLVVNRMPVPAITASLPLAFTSTERGAHTLTFEGVADMITDGFTVILKDNFTNTTTNIADVPAYAFNITTDAASQGTGRFVIVFTPSNVTGVHTGVSKPVMQLMPNPATSGNVSLSLTGFKEQSVSISIIDALGKTVNTRKVELSSGSAAEQLNVALSAGVYTVVCQSATVKTAQKLVIQ